MSEILGPDGQPVRPQPKRTGDACPQCRAGKNRRINTAGFGPPVICCGACGHHFEGATE